jgi:hypothetical protein
MLLATLALALLGSTVLTLNRSSTQHGTILQQTEIGVYGISMATSIVEEAQGLAFDETTVDNAVAAVSSLTSTMGPESGETTSPVTTNNYDDFDDFNNLNMLVNVSGVSQFRIQARVYYVTPTAPNTVSASRTWHKRMDVTVSAFGTTDTVRTSFIFSYFNFR